MAEPTDEERDYGRRHHPETCRCHWCVANQREDASAAVEPASPLPWDVVKNGLGQDCGVRINHGHAGPWDDHNTECRDCRYIVTACNERPAMLATIAAQQAELERLGECLYDANCDATMREAERDIARAKLARVEALRDKWKSGSNWGGGPFVEELAAALADPDTQERET